jgi:hypothetical protein
VQVIETMTSAMAHPPISFEHARARCRAFVHLSVRFYRGGGRIKPRMDASRRCMCLATAQIEATSEFTAFMGTQICASLW